MQLLSCEKTLTTSNTYPKTLISEIEAKTGKASKCKNIFPDLMIAVAVETRVDHDVVALLRLGLAFEAVLVPEDALEDRVVHDAVILVVAGADFCIGNSIDLEQVVGRRHRLDLTLQRLVLVKQRRQLT